MREWFFVRIRNIAENLEDIIGQRMKELIEVVGSLIETEIERGWSEFSKEQKVVLSKEKIL